MQDVRLCIKADLQPGDPPDDAKLALRAWNLMGGAVDWAALPILCEMFGIVEPEIFIYQLAEIRAAK